MDPRLIVINVLSTRWLPMLSHSSSKKGIRQLAIDGDFATSFPFQTSLTPTPPVPRVLYKRPRRALLVLFRLWLGLVPRFSEPAEISSSHLGAQPTTPPPQHSLNAAKRKQGSLVDKKRRRA